MKRSIAAEAVRVTLWTAVLCLLVALVTAIGVGTSAAADLQARPSSGTTSAAPAGEASTMSSQRALENKLRAARERLRRDAQEVASLSMQLGGARMGRMRREIMYASRFRGARAGLMIQRFGRRRVMRERFFFSRSIIGLQLDPASGPTGARVLEVSPGGPAADAGIRPGDVIVSVNGARISGDHTARKVLKHLRHVPPRTHVTMRVVRAGKTRQFTLTTLPPFSLVVSAAGPGSMPGLPLLMRGGASARVFLARRFGLPPLPALSNETAGMVLASLTPTLGTYFGADNGVLVLHAPNNDVFRLEDGDVIVSIGGREPMSAAHATRILSTYAPGERLVLKIVRHRKRLTLTITLPKAMPMPR